MAHLFWPMPTKCHKPCCRCCVNIGFGFRSSPKLLRFSSKPPHPKGWRLFVYCHYNAVNLHLQVLTELRRSEEHTSELQSLMRISYAVFCLKKKKKNTQKSQHHNNKLNN